jgi:hypothetical protein
LVADPLQRIPSVCQERLNRVSLGTKSKSFLKYNPDGSLTLFGAKSPGRIARIELGARAEWHVLALPPRLLGGQIHYRWKLDAARVRRVK